MEIVENMLGNVSVTVEECDVHAIHPVYSNLYKLKVQKNSQTERRKKTLLIQKEKRLECLNLQRGIDLNQVEDLLKTKTSEKLKISKISETEKIKGKLMLSEWLVDVPEDLRESWIVKLIPEGKRVFLITKKGWTKCYGRNGRFVAKFPSGLPGGNYSTNLMQKSCHQVALDGVLCWSTKTIYVMDVIFWGYLLTDCTAEFRMFWLKNKLEECTGIQESKSNNPYKIELLPTYSLEEVEGVLGSRHPLWAENTPRLDGVLFYHREGLYAAGAKSPLVVWLKPFMMTSVLGVQVRPEYREEMPLQYRDKMEVTTSGDTVKTENKPMEEQEEDVTNKEEPMT